MDPQSEGTKRMKREFSLKHGGLFPWILSNTKTNRCDPITLSGRWNREHSALDGEQSHGECGGSHVRS